MIWPKISLVLRWGDLELGKHTDFTSRRNSTVKSEITGGSHPQKQQHAGLAQEKAEPYSMEIRLQRDGKFRKQRWEL